MEVAACKLRPGDRVLVDHAPFTVLERRVPEPGVSEIRLLGSPDAQRPVWARLFEDDTPVLCLYRVCNCGTRTVDLSGSCGNCESSAT